MTELKITKGEWRVERNVAYLEVRGSDRQICDVYCPRLRSNRLADEDAANVELIAEAGTVSNETGLTPRQLVEKNEELLSAARWLYNFAHGLMEDQSRMDDSDQIRKIKEIIKAGEKS